jgi:hypothetical protein
MTEMTELTSPTSYPVTIWEGIGISIGAVLLVAVGLVGLIYKFLINAADPQRATLIAQSLMDYKLPGDAQGVVGINLGGAKIAIVSNTSFPKEPANLANTNPADLQGVELFIAKVPLDVETGESGMAPATLPPKPSETYDIFSSPDFSLAYRSGEEFQVTHEQTEEKSFCNQMVSVRIQEGKLTLFSQTEPVFAVKYDAIATLGNSKRQVTLTAIGQTAQQEADQVFKSLRCK